MNNQNPNHEYKTIELTGIERNTSAMAATDGSCAEMDNLRHFKGAWRPIFPKKVKDTIVEFIDSNGVTQCEIGEIWVHHVLPEDYNRGAYYIGNFTKFSHLATGIYMFQNTNNNGTPDNYQLLHEMLSGETLSQVYTFNNVLIIETNLDIYYSVYIDGVYTVNDSIHNIPFLNSFATCENFQYNNPLFGLYECFFNDNTHTFINPYSVNDSVGVYQKLRSLAADSDKYSGYVFYILV